MSTASTTDYPKLRPVDVRTQVQNGHVYFLLRDPLGLSETSLLVPQPWGVVLASLDGRTPAQEAAQAFQRRFGAPMPAGELQGLINVLDEAYLLDNDRAREAQHHAVDAYRSAPFRPPMLAGQGYPDSAADLRGIPGRVLG